MSTAILQEVLTLGRARATSNGQWELYSNSTPLTLIAGRAVTSQLLARDLARGRERTRDLCDTVTWEPESRGRQSDDETDGQESLTSGGRKDE